MKRFFLIVLLFSTVLSSCNFISGKRIRGNGNVITETRDAGTFHNVHISGNTDLYVKQDSVFTIRVVADENLMEYIITDINGTTLDIRQPSGIQLKPSKAIKVYISGPDFKKFEASGACDIFSENKIIGTDMISIRLSGASDIKMEIESPKVDAESSGAGKITLWGEAKDFRVDGSGSTDIKCFDLLTENTTVDISGAGSAEVFASVKLDVHVSGAADVRYKGSPAISQDISGAGSVKKVE